jgi:hypothetical protein
MSNFLSQLTRSEQARFLEERNYMNLEEIRGFCSARGIPYRIVADHATGKVKTTKDTDRKPIVLARVRRYLTTGEVGDSYTTTRSDRHGHSELCLRRCRTNCWDWWTWLGPIRIRSSNG